MTGFAKFVWCARAAALIVALVVIGGIIGTPVPAAAQEDAAAAHEALFAENRYPSANTCATCHPKHFREWSVSQHAYAQLSPIYVAIQNFINSLTSGSNGDFCLRCHSPVAANLGEPSMLSNIDRHPTAREGITCVVCHRIANVYNKASGRLALVEGGLLDSVNGPQGEAELQRVLANRGEYQVVTDPDEPGRKIHTKIAKFELISQPVFCAQCHDVTLFNGFRLEEAYSEYRMSGAARRGVTCQDCHMGKEEGVESGYNVGPAAVIGGVPTMDRKLTSHFFAGPDFSIIHAGIYPHNVEASQMASVSDWLKFDVAAGWGTEEFEDKVDDGEIEVEFPAVWEDRFDREDARFILDDQFVLLEEMRQRRLQVLRNGYLLGDVVTTRADSRGIRFKIQVRNGTDGHNVPTGFSGERLIWLHVTVTDATGEMIFESGDLDPNGDLRDDESQFVRSGGLPPDEFLFNLQSKFVVLGGRGGERERVIPIPFSVTALPVVRPSVQSLIWSGEPTTERNHRRSIPPLGERWPEYRVKAGELTGKGPYQVHIELKSAMVPVNLIDAVQSVGFDYGLTPRRVGDALVAGHEVLWEKSLTIDVDG